MCFGGWWCLFVFFLMIRRPPRATRTDTRFPYTTLFRSLPLSPAGAEYRSPPPDRLADAIGGHRGATESHAAQRREITGTAVFVFEQLDQHRGRQTDGGNILPPECLQHRSGERSGGTECVSTGRYRWTPQQ